MAKKPELTKLPVPLRTDAAAVYLPNQELRNYIKTALSYVSTYGDEFKLYKEVGDSIMLLPREICPLGVEDRRLFSSTVDFTSSFVPRSAEQARLVNEAFELLRQGESFIFEAPTGAGKCHGFGTKIRMFDGTSKEVQEVKPGDMLMGPDGTSRNVLSTTHGYGEMFRVVPEYGEPFTCNDVHILSLKKVDSEQITDIPLNEFLRLPKTKQADFRLWRPVGVLPNITDVKFSDVVRSKFFVEPLGLDDYYGFSISGDRRYLLEDLIVTHNTIMAAELIGRVGVTALVIVPKEDIIGQWRDAFKKVLGLKDSEIGRIQGDVCDVVGKKVIIGMIHSLGKPGRYPSWVYKVPNFVIWDEVHVVGAETFSETAWMFPAKLRLGLSASPYRKDGKDVIFYSHIGDVRVRGEVVPLKPKVLIQKTNWVPPLVNAYDPVKKCWGRGRMKLQPGRTQAANKSLAKDIERNNLIVTFACTAYHKGRNTIIFSDLKDQHLQVLHTLLVKQGIPTTDIAFYVGGMSQKQRDKAKVKPIILTTYQMCAMATDIPWLDTCILGTPRSDVLQIVGRVIREYETKGSHDCKDPNKVVPVIYDLVDYKADLFRAYGAKRRQYYRKIGAKIIEL